MWINMAFSASIFHQDGKQEGLLDFLPNISPSDNKRKMETGSRDKQHHNTVGHQCGNMQEIWLLGLCNWLDTYKECEWHRQKSRVIDMNVNTWAGGESFNFCFYISCYHARAMSTCHLAVGTDLGIWIQNVRPRWENKCFQGIKNNGWTESAQQLSLLSHVHFLLIHGPDGLWCWALPLALLLSEDFLRELLLEATPIVWSFSVTF